MAKSKYIVSFKTIEKGDVLEKRLAAFKKQLDGQGELIQRLDGLGGAIVEIPDALAKVIEKLPFVVAVEKEVTVKDEPFWDDSYNIQSEEWGIEATGVKNFWEAGFKGGNVRVAVLDSGYSAHQDIEGQVVENVDFTGSGTTLDNSGSAGHGTSSMGVIAAIDNTIGYAGYAPGAKLANLKVSNNGYGTNVWYAAGTNYVMENLNKYDIVMLNAQMIQETYSITRAAKLLRQAGKPFIVAGGNYEDGIKDSNGNVLYTKEEACPAFPARIAETISIGAIDETMEAAYYSCGSYRGQIDYGCTTNLWAPDRQGGYRFYNGTSCATPSATGLFTVLKSAYPHFGVIPLIALMDKGVLANADVSHFGKGFLRLLTSMLPAPKNYASGLLPAADFLGNHKFLNSQFELEVSGYGAAAMGIQVNATVEKTISFDFASADYSLEEEVQVLVNGAVVDTFVPNSANFQTKSYNLPVGINTLELRYNSKNEYTSVVRTLSIKNFKIADTVYDSFRIGFRQSHGETSYAQNGGSIVIHTIVGNEAAGTIDNYPVVGASVTHELRKINSDGSNTRYKTLTGTTGSDGRTRITNTFTTSYPKGEYLIATTISANGESVRTVGYNFTLI